MSALWSQLLSLVAAPPGNAVFHLILVFSVASALSSLLIQSRLNESPPARRAATALGIVLVGQAVVFLVGLLSALGLANSSAILPPFDRAVMLFSIVWITWLWAFPEPANVADTGVWVATLIVAASLGLSLISWSRLAPGAAFNQSLEDRLWQVNSIFFIFIGVALLYARKPNGFWGGITMLALAAVGHLGHLVIREPGNYSGFLRLAYLAAFPLLLTLPQRYATAGFPSARAAGERLGPPLKERRRHSTDPKTLQAFLELAGTDGAGLEQSIARSIGHAMLADLCFLVSVEKPANQSLRAVGYDLIREVLLEAGFLKRGAIPMISDAIERGKALRLPSSNTSADMKGLGEMLGLEKVGHLLCMPLVSGDRKPIGAILLLSPHSDRAWTADDQHYLAAATPALASLLEHAGRARSEGVADDDRRALLADLETRNLELTQQLDALRKSAVTDGERSEEVNSLILALEELQRSFDELQQTFGRLEAENEQLRAEAAAGSRQASDSQLEQELRSALEDIAHLENQLAEANHRTLSLELARGAQTPIQRSEVILAVAQEFRQSMTSLLGYLDLLLGESVGTLGVLQRKFAERMKSSAEQTSSLMDEMIGLLSAQPREGAAAVPAIDLNAIIDEAMSMTSGQVREKNISMHIDIPRSLPPIQVDAEALHQILLHLLQNAGSATPMEGAITLAVQATQDEGRDCVLLQVTDSGGGIAAPDVPRLFASEAEVGSTLIQGAGNVGPSLSVAKALTESQHGRMWVDSEPGVGSTFSVLLPVTKSNETVAQAAAEGR